MDLLLIINRKPYDRDAEVVWNALRLAQTSLVKGWQVRIFLMNEGVELARKDLKSEEEAPDVAKMFREVLERGAIVRLCKTCIDWHGIGEENLIPEAKVAGMVDLVNWIGDSQKVISF